jgi:hypothetical protein
MLSKSNYIRNRSKKVSSATRVWLSQHNTRVLDPFSFILMLQRLYALVVFVYLMRDIQYPVLG